MTALPQGSRTSLCGLVLPDELTREEWAALAPRFRALYSAAQWHLGDWLRFGERRWGEMYAELEAVTGRRYQTMANAVRVARAFPLERRRAGLTWSHHEAVTRLREDEQERWLTLAELNGWSVERLRREIRSEAAAPETSARTARRLGGRLRLSPRARLLLDACLARMAEADPAAVPRSRSQLIETLLEEWAKTAGAECDPRRGM